MSISIELKGVTFSYEGQPPIIKGVGFTAHAGEVLAIAGPVGGGKSTLLKLCAGLLEPEAGEVVIDRMHFWGLSPAEQNGLRRRMGFDFQEAALIANMTVSQNLGLSLRYHASLTDWEIKRKIEPWLERLDLMDYQNMLPAALSTGLRRRVSFARAMLSGGEFFFWDEPTEGAGEKFRAILKETIIGKKREGAGSMITTQDAAFMASVADNVLVLEGGCVGYCGPLKSGKLPAGVGIE